MNRALLVAAETTLLCTTTAIAIALVVATRSNLKKYP